MEKINVVIVDDEEGNIIILKGLIERYIPELEVVGTAYNKNEAKVLIDKVQPQLVFLDIEMPFGTGFDLLDEIGDVFFETIFVTAFDNYAIQAFKHAAIDYILKPINLDDIKAAVEKAIDNIKLKNANDRVISLLSNLRQHNQQQKIGVQCQEGLLFIRLTDITRLMAAGSYTIVYLSNGNKVTTSKILKDFEAVLPEANFVRIHHSHIINTNYLKHYFKGRGGYVEMEDGTSIEVSTRKKEEFLRKISI